MLLYLGSSQVSVYRTIGPTLVIVVVIPGHNLGNSQVSVNRTIGPTLVFMTCFICEQNIRNIPHLFIHAQNNKGTD